MKANKDCYTCIYSYNEPNGSAVLCPVKIKVIDNGTDGTDGTDSNPCELYIPSIFTRSNAVYVNEASSIY